MGKGKAGRFVNFRMGFIFRDIHKTFSHFTKKKRVAAADLFLKVTSRGFTQPED